MVTFRITNWRTYNKALINRGSVTFWLDDEAIQALYESATPTSRGRPQRYSALAITTVLLVKRVFRQTHRKIRSAAADGADDTRWCHDERRRKKISALIPPRKGAGDWPGEYADRNRAVAN
jgi:hypothetical protein